ncbi:uncharacterized protein LOC133779508 [Humulus lupulus]|uniref:uncharacterized protein LOC133779508 n=1 Tax=Humulus lupulus TaxID=3486 RepID=UPI002B407241|nr:uncharacterized protein LOC133779508 [Humulus lupulus]
MANNNYQWPSERPGSNKNVAGVHELDAITTLTAQVASLTKQLQQNTMSAQVVQAQCQAITLRSGKEIEDPSLKETQQKKAKEEGSYEKVEPQVEEKVIEGLATKEKFQLEVVDSNVKIPYPQRLRKTSLDKQFSKFLEKKLPPKLKDLGSFAIPCSVEDTITTKALCDLGASINLMLLSIFRKLKLGEARPTTVSLQMVDRSVKQPRGVIEDVLVKVGKFIFPTDFIILDMEEDANIPIILGRTFLAIGTALIDVQKGELKLRVQNEEVKFNVFAATDIPTCCRVDVVCSGGSNLETTKRKTNAKIGSRAFHHCLKRYYSGKARRLHEKWKAPTISNIKR